MKILLIVALFMNSSFSMADSTANNQIGFKLFKQISKEGENTFISPASIYSALSLAFEGSQGKVRTQAIHFLRPTSQDSFRSNLQETMQRLQTAPSIEFISSNSIWTDSTKVNPPADAFSQKAKSQYSASLHRMPFEPKQSAASKMNAWAKESTKGMIDTFIDSSALELVQVLVANAIYFKGDWKYPFEPSLTKIDTFFGEKNKTRIDMMEQETRLPYFENKSWQVVRLPYGKGEVELVVLLPKKKSTLTALQNKLTADALSKLIDNTVNATKVQIRLPKLTLSWGTKNIASELRKIGMPQVGDFSHLGCTDEMAIDSVVHKAIVKINEKGSEAAAVTGVTMIATSFDPTGPVEFHANHPFLIIIRETASKEWLFLGRISSALPN